MTASSTIGHEVSDRATLRFSVIVPTYQRRDLVRGNIAALARQEFEANFEVIVVVDGSTDGTAESLRDLRVPFQLKVIEQANAGSAAARNHGATRAKGELLLFLDDDMEAHPKLLAEHDCAHRAGAAAVMGDIPAHPETTEGLLAQGVKKWSEDRAKRLSQPGAQLTLADMLTGQLSVSLELFQRLSGFDTRFRQQATSGNADTDFGCRLLNSGCRVVFNPRAISWQKYIVTPRQYLRQWREVGRADVRLVYKHADRWPMIFTPKKLAQRRWWMTPPVAAVLRWVFLKRVEQGRTDQWTARGFKRVRWYEYWRGVAEAGGIPPNGTLSTPKPPTGETPSSAASTAR
jgi:glycosyltransferase involved in cell wall biosynthesis